MPSPASYPAAKASTLALYQATKALHDAIATDPRDLGLGGVSEYLASGPQDALRRAEALLAKDHYKLCFAGGFSAGKSTTINALLGEPDLLPTAAGECTLAITIMTGPIGGRECVRVKYFPKDVAIRGVIFHQKRYRNAFKRFEERLKGAGQDQMLAVIREVIAWLPKAHSDESLPEALRKEFDRNKAAKYAAELEEFLGYLDKFASRCGNIVDDVLDNRAMYLTYDDKQGGLGHLFMVDQVFIHKKNILFEEKAVQIVDLPGIDSTNSYARQVTLDYLNAADLVLNVLPPQGFTMSYIDIINEVGAANRGNIVNKMFYIINRFDANEDRNFSKKELESLLRDQIAAEIDKNGLNSKNLFAACAIMDIYKLRGNQAGFDALYAANQNKVKALAGTDEPWASMAKDALEGRAITNIRNVVLKYLEEQLAFERLRDVRLACSQALESADGLLGRNGPLLAQARARKQSAIGEMRDFISKTNQAFEVNLRALADHLPKVIGDVARDQLKPAVGQYLGVFRNFKLADASFQAQVTSTPARLQTPAAIKQHWIDWAKVTFSDKFVETVHQTLVGNVQGLIDQQVKASKVDEILTHIGAGSSKDLVGPLAQAIAIAKQNVDLMTRLRADEETWPIRNQPLAPTGFEAAWSPSIEQAFKEDIVGIFAKTYNVDRLAAALGQYYKSIVLNLVKEFHGRSDDLESALRNTADLELPTHLLSGGTPDPDERKRRRLVAYADLRDKAADKVGGLKAALG